MLCDSCVQSPPLCNAASLFKGIQTSNPEDSVPHSHIRSGKPSYSPPKCRFHVTTNHRRVLCTLSLLTHTPAPMSPNQSPNPQLTCYSVPLRSLFTGVTGTSPLTLSVPPTDIRLLRSFWLDLCSTFVTLNLRREKERCVELCFSSKQRL